MVEPDNDDNGATVYSCNTTDTDSYCCYEDCECDEPFEVFSFRQPPADVYTVTIIAESFTQTHTSTPPPTSAPTRSTSPTQAASLSASPEPESGSKLNTIALGVGLGVGIPAAAAILAGAFLLWSRKRRSTVADGTPEKPFELGQEGPVSPTKYPHSTSLEVEGYVESCSTYYQHRLTTL